MKVLFLPGWYPNRTHATLGNFVQRHAEAVSAIHEVTVFHHVRDPAARRMEWESRSQGGLAEHVLYANAGPLARTRALIRKIADHQQAHGRFHLLHGNILHATALQLWLIHRLWRIPFLVSENWTGYHLGKVRELPFAVRFAMRLAGKRASLLCPVSEQLAGAMRHHGFNGPFRVVPNVVDTDQFHPGETTGRAARTRFLHISTLVDAHKNVSGLLQAFAESRLFNPSIQLHIVGDGDATPHQALAERLGLNMDAVRFSGPAAPGKIAQYMRESDAFVLPSNVENLPCVMLEAFASGLPVLATTVGGIPAHLAPERGILFAAGDLVALHQAMTSLANGTRSFDPSAIRRYAVEQFSKPVVAQAFDAAYRYITMHG